MPFEKIEYYVEETDNDRLTANDATRSELAKEIISENPSFLEQWALFIFLLLLFLLFILSWMIQYPDIVEATATLTATNAPKEIIPVQGGRIVKLFAQNNDKVQEKEIIAWIESTANHTDVIELSKQIDSSENLLSTGDATKVVHLFDKNYNNLGEIQQPYQTFITAFQNYNDYIVNGFFQKKKKMLQCDLHSLKNTYSTIQNQILLSKKDMLIAEETYNMNKKLADEKVLSKEEFRQEKSKLISKQMELPQLNASLITNETQQRDKIKELDQLDHDILQQPQDFLQALHSLKSDIDSWKKKFLIQSPINGNISFIIPLQENQYLQSGKIIGYVIPKGSRYYTQIYLPQNNFGKIDTGLQVQLRMEAYPYQEYGVIEGRISYISNVASDSGFLASVRLDNGLITSLNKQVVYKNGLKAQAIIITKNMRLLSRLWYSIKRSISVGNN
ncbi:MAG: HlyD family efflux transporter periplasmic adaptor subunit [Bacteroidetes bacterium]|nr:HlyD family efflux transporter periplasmic adaptor subunit [Bacteroidota bacterium]